MSMPLNTIEKILARIARHENGCWLWTGSLSAGGYGITAYHRKKVLVHRLTYTVYVGPIPDGYQIDHLCRVRQCCNPAHLEAVTPAVNNLRAGIVSLTGYCRKGLHNLTEPGSLRTNKNGKRTCAECHRASQRQSWARVKARRS